MFLLDQRDGRIEQSLARVDAATKAQPKDSALARLAGAFPARLRSERDRWMLLALIRLLPAVVA